MAETDGTGNIQKIYINDGVRIIGMIKYNYKEDGTFSNYEPLYFMFDSLGSVSLVTGINGKPLQDYKYTPYGETWNVTKDSVNNLRFVGAYGGYTDDDTNLTYFWHRWYDSKDGRWVSRDPINIRGGIILYEYVGNEPNKWKDTNGYCPGAPDWQPLPTPTKPLVPTKTPNSPSPSPCPQERTVLGPCLDNRHCHKKQQ